MIRISHSVEKEKESSFQSCNYLHQEFKAWTYAPPPRWFIVHKSLRVAAKWFCGGLRIDISTAGLKVLRGCLLHLHPTRLLWRLPCTHTHTQKRSHGVCVLTHDLTIPQLVQASSTEERCAMLSIAGGFSRPRASLGFMAGEEVTRTRAAISRPRLSWLITALITGIKDLGLS